MNDFECEFVMGISGRESTSDIGGEEAETLPEATKCGGGSGGAPVKRERSGIRKSHVYGGRKSPFPQRRKKRVDEKVVPFVKLVGPIESPRREDK